MKCLCRNGKDQVKKQQLQNGTKSLLATYLTKDVLQFQKLKKIYYENGWSNPTRVAFGFSKIAKDLHSVSSPQHTNIQKMEKPRYGSELDF